MLRGAILSLATILVGALPAGASVTAAWMALEKICRERPYTQPLDYAAVAHAMVWQDMDNAQLAKATALLGGLRSLQKPFIDARSAPSAAIAETFGDMQVQVLADLTTGRIGVHYLEGADFVAFAPYRPALQKPAVPCEIHVIGRAGLLDDRYASPDWQRASSKDAQVTGQITDRYWAVISKAMHYGENIRAAGLTLPDYVVSITGFGQ